jgi:hypothetical protein
MSGKVRKEHQSASVSGRALERSITVAWEATAPANAAPDYTLRWNPATNSLGNCKTATESQEFLINFYPTAIGKLTDTEILVCGMKAGGITVIQKWVFTWAFPLPQVVEDPGTGLLHVAIALPTVQKTTLYSSFNDPIVGISGLKRAGGPLEALVQFASYLFSGSGHL